VKIYSGGFMKRQNSIVTSMLERVPDRVPALAPNSLPAAGMAVMPLVANGLSLVTKAAELIADDRNKEREYNLKVLMCQESSRIEHARIDSERQDNRERHQEKMKNLEIIEKATQDSRIEIVLQALVSLAHIASATGQKNNE